MQIEKLINQPPEKERYFEPSSKENMFDVFQRVLDKSIMMYRISFLGTFTKEAAKEKIKFQEIKPEIVQDDLSAVKDDSVMNTPQEKLNMSFEPVGNLIVNKSIEEKPEKEIKINSLDWQFLKEKDPEEDKPGFKYTNIEGKANNKRSFRGML